MEKLGDKASRKATIDKPISIVCIVLIFAFVIVLIAKPDATLNVVSTVFDYATTIFGTPILWFVFIGLFLCLYLAFSIEPYSQEAAEYSLAYAFFHWGFAVQVVFVLTAICMAYGFYVKKVPHLRVSAICEAMMGDFKHKKVLGRVIDALTVLSVIGGVGVVSMGVGVQLRGSHGNLYYKDLKGKNNPTGRSLLSRWYQRRNLDHVCYQRRLWPERGTYWTVRAFKS